MEKRFHCTACGKCCYGQLPLALKDALAWADLFPLALVLTPISQASKERPLAEKLGASLQLGPRQKICLRIMIVSYLPPSLPCPALLENGLCRLHPGKPLRCRTMPFFPFVEEKDQALLLLPRKGWACDVSAAAPVVYRDRKIVERGLFDQERASLLDQAPLLRQHAKSLVETAPWIAAGLARAATQPSPGRVVVNFSSLLPRLPQADWSGFAALQAPVLRRFESLTAGQPEHAVFHGHYRDWAAELERRSAV
jgi:Fe-S-cluster containining protein